MDLNAGLDALFNPSSVAVLGASDEPGSYGDSLMRNLLSSFKGDVFPVNPRGGEMLGRPVFKSVKDTPSVPDSVILLVPSKKVPEVLDECGSVGVKSAVVVGAGFRESGQEGAKLEEEITSICRKRNIALLGPNCLGVYNPSNGLDMILNPSDRQGMPAKGHIAIVTQSGGLGAALLDWMASRKIGLSKFVSFGNAAMIDVGDLVSYLSRDDETRVICIYLEGVKDGRVFMDDLRRCAGKKPVLVLKVGRTQGGSQAARSHTGVLAGSDRVFDAVFKQAGALRVGGIRELFAKAVALSSQPLPRGGRVGVVTNGGGLGVLAADLIPEYGLSLVEFAPKLVADLKALLPKYVNVANPLDLVGDATSERYEAALLKLYEEDGIDSILVMALLQSPRLDVQKFTSLLRGLASRGRKPIVACLPGGDFVEKVQAELSQVVPVYETPEDAMYSLQALREYAQVNMNLSVSDVTLR